MCSGSKSLTDDLDIASKANRRYLLRFSEDGSFFSLNNSISGRWVLNNRLLTLLWNHQHIENAVMRSPGGYNGTIKLEALTGTYWAEHQQWENFIRLKADGTFSGGAKAGGGKWNWKEDRLELDWYHWPSELLYYRMNRCWSGSFQMQAFEGSIEPRISIVVPCMGRLDHLKATIPFVISQPNCEYILVDYSCPEKSGRWAQSHYPDARVLFVLGQSTFNLSRARNVGAEYASAEWICFLDCDVIPSGSFLSTLRTKVEPASFMALEISLPGLSGVILCKRSHFHGAGEFDEHFDGWGGEDDDLKYALKRIGLKQIAFPPDIATHIDHGDEERVRYYQEKDKEFSSARAVKRMISKGYL